MHRCMGFAALFSSKRDPASILAITYSFPFSPAFASRGEASRAFFSLVAANVRFQVKSGHCSCASPCPLSANSGREAKRDLQAG